MAYFNPKINIPTAIDSRNSFDLSCDHVTTMNFMESRVTYCKEVMPGETTHINVESFTRLSPLVVPTFGRMSIIHRAFFVPFRTVFNQWNAFITRSFYNGVAVTRVPYVYNSTIDSLLIMNQLSETVTSGAFDFADSNGNKHKFTVKGRNIYNLLVSLGYRGMFTADYQTKCSLLPLLCYAKAMRDWIFNENFNQTAVNHIDYFIEHPDQLSSLTNFYEFLNYLYTGVSYYEQDYFTSSTVNPNGPNGTLVSSTLTVPNNNSTAKSVTVDSSKNDAVIQLNSGGFLNQFALDTLKHVADYLKRHQLVGSKIIDRYLTQFGIKLDNNSINRSTYLGKSVCPIQIGDVMSTADTDGSVLGNYAGRGLGYDKTGSFDISDIKEFGMVIVISQIVPKIGYVQGINRNILHLEPNDFFTPEFDGQGYQAIAKPELFVSKNGSTNESYLSNEIFGFTPHYAEYKSSKDMLTGNYLFDSVNVGEDSWYLFRKFVDGDVASGLLSEINENFVSAVSDRSRYMRIFNGGSELGIDPFRCIFHFEVKSSLPCSKLFDNYEWHDRGKQVSETVNGSGNLAGLD